MSEEIEAEAQRRYAERLFSYMRTSNAFGDFIKEGTIEAAPPPNYTDDWAEFNIGQRVFRVYRNRTVEVFALTVDDPVLTVPNAMSSWGRARVMAQNIPAMHQIRLLDDVSYHIAMQTMFFVSLNTTALTRAAAANGLELNFRVTDE